MHDFDSISFILPLCSPRNTSLNFRSGLPPCSDDIFYMIEGFQRQERSANEEKKTHEIQSWLLLISFTIQLRRKSWQFAICFRSGSSPHSFEHNNDVWWQANGWLNSLSFDLFVLKTVSKCRRIQTKFVYFCESLEQWYRFVCQRVEMINRKTRCLKNFLVVKSK